MANQYIRDLSKNVKRGNRAKLEQGQFPGKAPFGYLNDMVNKTIIVDAARKDYVRQMFVLCAKGYSVKEIANKLYAQGLRSQGGYKVGKSVVHRILHNPFYYGVMLRNGRYYDGKYEPIITKQMFDEAQAVLLGKNRPRKQQHFFTYRGFMTCASCGCALTADKKKGHNYYTAPMARASVSNIKSIYAVK